MCKLNQIRQMFFWSLIVVAWNAGATEFNTDMLDANDLNNVDISQFSVAGYVPPGNYLLTVFVNGLRLGEPRHILVFKSNAQPDIDLQKQTQSPVCVPFELLLVLGLKPSAIKDISTSNDGKCLNFSRLDGTKTKIDLATLSLNITIPHMWMEYRDPYWVPPALWEEGINGIFVDYNANASVTKEQKGDRQVYLSTNGTAGMNVGAWRFRGDYNAAYQQQKGHFSQEKHQFDFNRLYAFTSLKEAASVLTLGENYFYSDIFDAWQYTGLSLESDDRMLPPKLVGYAPEITGVASTNAIVIVRSDERIISETSVPPGPFRIQTLDSGIRGVLDVTVREENGEEKKFSVSTASLPYLTRPGRTVYKLAAGKTRYDNRHLTGEPVMSGEFSHGVSNAWSLYGGSQFNAYYQSVALGVGRDLFSIGAISFDISQSFADLPEHRLQGRSYRMNYAKSFDYLRTDITFAGYRFADKEYRTLTQFMDEERTHYSSRAAKENYQLYLNKYFNDFNVSMNYQYSTYWQGKSQTQYGLYATRGIAFPQLSQFNGNLTVSANRTERDTGDKDDSINLYFTLPLYSGQSLTFSEIYSRTAKQNRFNHAVGYHGYGEHNSYSMNVGYNHGQKMDNQASVSGFYSHDLSLANTSLSASYVPDQYHSFSGSINSGITLTSKGIALHRSAYGDTRLLVETPDAQDVPFGNGIVKTNTFGLAVIPNVSSYRKTTASINVSQLPENIETLESTTDITLTKGAIGYRQFSVMKGEKLFAVITLTDGNKPPFGASVRNANNQEIGLVGEEGVTWLVGVSPNEKLSVYWRNQRQCELTLPTTKGQPSSMILLPCVSIM